MGQPNLKLSELKKRPSRIETFAEKVWSSDPFVTVDNRQYLVESIQIKDNVYFYHNKDDKNRLISDINSFYNTSVILNGLYVDESAYQPIITSSLSKTAEFGGKGKNGSLLAEMEYLSLFKNKIYSIASPFNIQFNNILYTNIVDVKKSNYSSKSDFELIDNNGNSVFWISHKDYTFHGWSGCKSFVDIPIVQNFVNDVKIITSNIMPHSITYGRPIPDNNTDVKYKSIFGKEYNGSYSENNVQMVAIGSLKLNNIQDNTYTISSYKYWYNTGNYIDFQEYSPVMMAMYKGDRSNFDVKGARFDIWPSCGRKYVVI